MCLTCPQHSPMFPSPQVNPESDVPPYPGSELSVSQLLVALDRKIPAEIAWLESNVRHRGAFVHFRKPEVLS